METTTATVYLIPLPVAEGAVQTLSPQVAEVTSTLTHYFVEDARTARRFLRLLHATLPLESCAMSVMDKHTGADLKQLNLWLKEGHSVGIMSEAGCPGIADPGAQVVARAHELGAPVVPLTGPSALLLALMASGLNGQSFAFNG
ncbi:MAG: SAM-dependent methyltransferase, partial [Chitinophagia bacterium]|nr:SAM-dependent methyltransferase [Chitinophagia bacterium]